ncbi:hypothetical protein ALC62_06868 [Cyphomyrmex costatus]|uniref:Uncharacterized protein n=1 Tax=Cyphomyrmex costatus TaxID=456900 RepID=A0A151IIF5_9HYME|nr:hypothetical protein ALC62_06868 [Cyphomyrmex costatus]
MNYSRYVNPVGFQRRSRCHRCTVSSCFFYTYTNAFPFLTSSFLVDSTSTSVREGRVAGEYWDGGGRLEGVEEREDKDEEHSGRDKVRCLMKARERQRGLDGVSRCNPTIIISKHKNNVNLSRRVVRARGDKKGTERRERPLSAHLFFFPYCSLARSLAHFSTDIARVPFHSEKFNYNPGDDDGNGKLLSGIKVQVLKRLENDMARSFCASRMTRYHASGLWLYLLVSFCLAAKKCTRVFIAIFKK